MWVTHKDKAITLPAWDGEILCSAQVLSGVLRFGVKMKGYGNDYIFTASFSSDGEYATIQGFALDPEMIRMNKAIADAAFDECCKLHLGMRWERKHKNADGSSRWFKRKYRPITP